MATEISKNQTITDLDMDTDYIEITECVDVSTGQYKSQRIQLKQFISALTDDTIENYDSNILSLKCINIGTIFFTSIIDIGDNYDLLLNSDYIPLVKLDDKDIVLEYVQDEVPSISTTETQVIVKRNDIQQLIEYLDDNKCFGMQKDGETRVKITCTDLDNRYIYNNCSDPQGTLYKSSAPLISGNFINGNINGSDLTVTDCFKLTDNTISVQLQSLNNSGDSNTVMRVKFTSANSSDIYKNQDNITVDSYGYVMCVYIKDQVITV